jgi:hypothetical protein
MMSDREHNRRFGWLLAAALGASMLILLASLSYAAASVQAFA